MKRNADKTKPQFLSRTPAPSILHACVESRALGLKFYAMFNLGNHFSGTFVNWNIDLIFINQLAIYDFLSEYSQTEGAREEVEKHCQRIGFSGRCHGWLKSLDQFENLKEVTIVEEPSTGIPATILEFMKSQLKKGVKISCKVAEF